MSPILAISGLSVVRDRTAILRGVAWQVRPGEHWVILGPNGSGKTSLLKALTGYLTPTAGEITLLGEHFGASDWRELRLKVGMVTSSFTTAIPPAEPALETVVSGKFAQLDLWAKVTRTDRAVASRLLRFVGAGRLADREWIFLSQGERQRVLIARALMAKPRLLILDEPCAGLDPVAREKFLRFLDRLAGRRSAPALVLVTHHIEEITPRFSHVLLLRRGRVLATGRRARVLTSQNLSAAFGARLKLLRVRRRSQLAFLSAVNPLREFIDSLGFTNVWTYLAVFLGTSLLMIWRLEAMLDHGLEGTALGTVVMPYCSGLGNLLFVAVIAARHGPGREVLTNCLVNNVTDLTVVLGLPAVVWGLKLRPDAGGKARKTGKSGAGKKALQAETEHRLNRLSLLLTLAAVLFFCGVTWALSIDGRLDRNDGLVLVALFIFWQCFQVFDVLKHNIRQRRSFSAMLYVDIAIVLAGAYGQYVSIDWLVEWLSGQQGSFINAAHLGWLSGWLMVLPNALIAFYYAAKGRADIVYASQVGDGHICIPLCLGLSAFWQPLAVPPFFLTGLAILMGAALVHVICVGAGSLPRWMGWPLLAAYAWFVGTGLLGA